MIRRQRLEKAREAVIRAAKDYAKWLTSDTANGVAEIQDKTERAVARIGMRTPGSQRRT